MMPHRANASVLFERVQEILDRESHMRGFLMLSILFLIISLYLFLSPRDTLHELKLVFDSRVIRRGLRFRLPRRLPRLRLPKLRFSISTILVVTASTAVYIGFMRAQQEPLFNVIVIAVVFLICAAVVVLVATNTQGRGVLRKQRASYRPAKSVVRKPTPKINVDMTQPRHVTKTFDDPRFPDFSELETSELNSDDLVNEESR